MRGSRRLAFFRRHRLLRWVLSLGALLSLIASASGAAASIGVVNFPGEPPVAPLNTHAKYLVLMVLDGARPDYFNLVPLPHIDALIKGGTEYTHAFAGVLESETPTGHATISTGSTPQRSGILGFSWAENDRAYSIFNPTIVRSGAMEHIMQNAHAPTIAALYKARYPGSTVVALSGYKYYAADPLGGPSADAIIYLRGTLQKTYAPTAIPGHIPPASILNDPALTVPLKSLAFGQDDAMVSHMAIDTLNAMHPNVMMINYPDFDWPLGHVDGGITARAKVVTLMQGIDQQLGQIEDAYRSAGILKKTIFVITADHGMMPLARFIPGSVVETAIKRAGATSSSVSRNTATYVWLKDPTKAEPVAQEVMNAHDPGVEAAYFLISGNKHFAYLPAPGVSVPPALDTANRYLLSTLVNGYQPNVVVFARNHQTMSSSTTHWKADHGGNSWSAQHVPLVINGPGIAAGQVDAQPAQLEDIAPTVLTAMGVRATGMQGHVLTDALQTPFTADVVRRAKETKRMTPIVNALISAG